VNEYRIGFSTIRHPTRNGYLLISSMFVTSFRSLNAPPNNDARQQLTPKEWTIGHIFAQIRYKELLYANK
jgi:hypothetical protein